MKLYFSFASEPDAGMYDAVNKGFRSLAVAPGDILTWINADDRLSQGALATVAHVLRDVPECRLLSGRISILTADGEITGVNAASIYTQADLAAGLHDGRDLPFIMQEGTFFTGDLWLDVGGADPNFLLAGDWDLWRRMALKKPHYSLDTVTGFHRRRPGQLSEDMLGYYREVDMAVAEPVDATSLATYGNLIRHQAHLDAWVSVKVDPLANNLFDFVSNDVLEAAVPWRCFGGFGPPEGPYPEYNLPANVRWIRGDRGLVQVAVPETSRYVIRATLRASSPKPIVRFQSGSRIVYERELAEPRALVDSIIEFSCWLTAGQCTISIETFDGDAAASTLLERSLLVVALDVATDRSSARHEILRRTAASSGVGGALGLAFVVRTIAHAEKLDETLTSLVASGAGRRSIFIENDGDPLTIFVAKRFDPFVEMLADVDDISDGVLLAKGYRMRFDVIAGDRLSPGALELGRSVLHDIRADEVVGVTNCFDRAAQLTRRAIDGKLGLRVLGTSLPLRTVSVGSVFFSRQASTPLEKLGSVPRVVLYDDDRDGSPLLLAAAKGFALLGCDTRLVRGIVDSQNSRSGGSLSISCDEQLLHGKIWCDETRLRVVLTGGIEIAGPVVEDVDAFQSTTRAQARELFAIGVDYFAVALFGCPNAAATNALVDYISRVEEDRHFGIILCAGALADARLERRVICDLRETFDAELRRYVFAAADIILNLSPDNDLFSTTAAFARTPVCNQDQISAELLGLAELRIAPNRSLDEAHNRAVAGRSIEAFALSLREQAAHLLPSGAIADWLSRRTSLAAGEIEMRTNDLRLLNTKASCSLTPIVGAVRTLSCLHNGLREEFIACGTQDALVALEVCMTEVRAVYLRVYVEHDGEWQIFVDGALALSRWLHGKAEHELVCETALELGTHRLALKRVTGESAIGIAIIEVEVLATANSQQAALRDATFVFAPFLGKEVEDPTEDGDWRRLSGFHDNVDAAHPQFGLHKPFVWSKRTFEVALWSGQEANRAIVVSIRGNHAGQRLRFRLRGIDHDWSDQLAGSLAANRKIRWTAKLHFGLNKLEFEVSSITGTPNEREIGVILEGVHIEEPNGPMDLERSLSSPVTAPAF